jgi:hypothetical protein
MNKSKLLHIGFPKCMSTSLQRDLFATHPEIMFLGWGLPDTEHGWISDEISVLCEVGIRYEKVLNFQKRSAKKALDRYFAEFERSLSKKAICLSYESFSFTMHFDVDPAIKAERLRYLFGKDAKVLIVIRNQLDLIRSYYFECIRGGYPGQFSSFLDFNFHYQFHSIFSDLRYCQLYKLYCRLFNKENVLLMPMESIVANPREMVESICGFAGVATGDFPLQRHNNSDDLRYLQAVRMLNEKFPNNRGQSYFSWIDDEKLRPYWRKNIGIEVPIAAKQNHSMHMMVLRTAKSVTSDFVNELKADFPPGWTERMRELYQNDNLELAELTGLDLSGLGYIL